MSSRKPSHEQLRTIRGLCARLDKPIPDVSTYDLAAFALDDLHAEERRLSGRERVKYTAPVPSKPMPYRWG